MSDNTEFQLVKTFWALGLGCASVIVITSLAIAFGVYAVKFVWTF